MKSMLKRITAFICSMVMLIAVLSSITVVNATDKIEDCWTNTWGSGNENVTFKDGVIILDGANGKEARWGISGTMSTNITLRFSAKLDIEATMGVQFYNGESRSGFYLSRDRMSPFGQSVLLYPIGTDWHDYRIDVVDNQQSIYVDNQYVGTVPSQTMAEQGTLIFWTNAGGKMQVGYWSLQPHDGKAIKQKTATYAGDWLPGEDYTPGFTQDWKTDLGHWYLADLEALEWDKEAGVLRFDGSKAPDESFVTAQHALNIPKNFDWKWKWRLLRNTNSSIQAKFYGDGVNTYLYVQDHNKITSAYKTESIKDGSDATRMFTIPIFLGENYGEWVDMELQRRDEYLTLLVNGGKVKTWRAYDSNDDLAMIGWNMVASGIGNTNSDSFEVGEMSYIPYFPEVNMVCPIYGSEYAQGTDVELQALPETEVDYIDYYVDDVKVGRGYAPNYKYTLKNVQVGSYNVSAGVGDQRSVATVMKVKPAFTAELNISTDEIKYGETVEANISTDAFEEAVDAEKVEYYVNGKLAATSNQKPFKVTLADFGVGTASVYAKVTNKQDVILTTDVKTVNVYTDSNDGITFNREYDISYKYNGGTGKIEAEDGYFKLSVENSGKVLKYLDEDGSVKEFSTARVKDSVTGYGDWRIVTTSGFAEVYYNGQMLTSFYMPRCENANKLSYSGIENFRMTGSGCKYLYFSKDWTGESDYKSENLNIGTYNALEFDKTDLSDEVIEYYDGRYQVQLRFENGKIYTREQGRVGSDIKENFCLEQPAEVGYYRVNITEGAAQVWCNNKYIGSMMGVAYAHMPQVTRKMTNPSASTIIELKNLDGIYYHSEDFSGNNEMEPFDYWVSDRDVKAEIKTDDENGWNYASVSSGSEGRFYLNGYTKDLKFKAKVKVESGKDFYILTRMHPTYYDSKLGYDFEKGCFYAEYDVFNGESRSIGSDRRTFPGEFTTGVWHDIEVTNNERHLVMKVDGKTVIDTSDLWLVLAGNAGFGIVGGTVNFTDVYYEGRGKVGCGVNGQVDNQGTSYNDFVQLKDGRVASFSTRGGTRYTSDRGRTWTAPSGAAMAAGGTNVLQTLAGTWVKAYAYAQTLNVAVSTDEGATWKAKQIPLKHETSYLIVQNNFSNVAKNGRLLVTSDEGLSEESGKVGIWWSDDNGETWTESDTFIEATVNGVNGQEASLVDMPEDGHYRIFIRTDRNYLYYCDSWDDCKTFDQMKMMPSPFKSTCTTFKIKRDIYEDQTYYALWTYETESNWQGSRNEPRNRVALAVSYDGMKSWEFVQSILDVGDYPTGLVRNYSMSVMEDAIYISMPGQANDCFLMGIEKSKIKTTKRFEELFPRNPDHIGATSAGDEADSLSVIPNVSGRAWILGNYEDVDVQAGGFVSAEVLAKAFKCNLEKSGNTITFKIGDGYVKFTDGSSSYDVNGTITDFGSVCAKDGYININACGKAFGREITENTSGNGWVIWADLIYTEYYRKQLEELI